MQEACSRALSYVRPLRCGSCGRGPAWCSRTGSKSLSRARSPAAVPGSSGPVFPTLAPALSFAPGAQSGGRRITPRRARRPSRILSFLSFLFLSRRPSRRRASPVSVAPHRKRPDDPGHPVRQGHRGHLERLLPDHPPQPGIRDLTAPPVPQHGDRPLNRQAPDVALPHLRDPPEPLPAGGRMLTRGQPRPGGEVPAASEALVCSENQK